jgi:CheY-like chemotaxis protein
VFGNLLHNACKFTDAGGSVRVELARDGDEARLSIDDDGVGIPAAELDGIFEMFAQAEQGAQHSSGGLGIGLTLVKQLVELHGGSVAARSDGPDRGSTFVVRLPLAAGPAATDPRAGDAERSAPSTSGLRILVADDHRDAVTGLAHLLRLHGHDVRTAEDGEAALEVARAFRPAVALLDIGMPRLAGYEVARRIRGDGWADGLTLIALPGWGPPADRERSVAAGIDRHLVKPLDLGTLNAILAERDAAGTG